MVLRTKEEALNALIETVKATKESHSLVYTGHGVVEVLKDKDCEGYAVIENCKATYNLLLSSQS